jgi:hypothetical protein
LQMHSTRKIGYWRVRLESHKRIHRESAHR